MNKLFIFDTKIFSMKRIFVLLLLSFFVSKGFSQWTPPDNTYGKQAKRSKIDSTLYIPTGCGVPTDSTFLHDKTMQKQAAKYFDSCGHNEYVWDPSLKIWKQGSADSATFLTHTQGDARYVAIQTQSPTASLSGGYSYERHASGTFSVSLSWSAGRQAAGTGVNATNTLSSIVVAGTSQTFTQPSAGSSVSGSQSTGTMNYNTNYTFYNTVTTTDSKTAVASTSFGAYDKRYLGWSATTTPTSAEILAAVYQDNSGNNSSLTNTLAQLGSDKHLFFVTTSTVSSVTVNGFPSTAAFSLNNSISFTNASGGTFTGYYTVSNNAFGSTSTNTVIFN